MKSVFRLDDVLMSRASIVVLKEIGRGGNGIVEEVWPSPDASASVARKRLHEENHDDPEIAGRFRREIRVLLALDHPHIINVLDAELDSDDPYFLMPLAQHSLADETERGALAPDRIKMILRVVLDALEYAHEQGVVHRDLKPNNILVMPDGAIMLTDFGLSLRVNRATAKLTRTGTGRGTQGYAAPEQWTDAAHVDRRADIFALGSLLFEMSTGRTPLSGDPRSAPAEYQRVIAKCRAHHLNARYQSVVELRADLELLWSDDKDFAPVVQRAIRLLEQAARRPADRRSLMELYRRNIDDSDLYRHTIPAWSAELVNAQVEDSIDETLLFIDRLCDHLPGHYPFAFLDDVATFLARFYEASTHPELRERVLTALLQVGADANRWSMGRTFARLAAQAHDRHDLMLVRDVLRDHPHDALWAESYIRTQVREPLILGVLDVIQAKTTLENVDSTPVPDILPEDNTQPSIHFEIMEDRYDRSDPVRDFAAQLEQLEDQQQLRQKRQQERIKEYVTFLESVAIPTLQELADSLTSDTRSAMVRRFTNVDTRDRETAERVELEVRSAQEPTFICVIYAVIVPERAFVKRIATEVNHDVFPPLPTIQTRFSDYALVPDTPKLNDAKTISREEFAESVTETYLSFLRGLSNR